MTTLYPSSCRPQHGIFVETRLRKLCENNHDCECRVIAPVPWFPFKHPVFGLYASYAAVPASEVLHGLVVEHPRYVSVPVVGKYAAPISIALCFYFSARRLKKAGFNPDVIDAHYFYPDAVAAVLCAKWMKLPVVATARGSDINLFARHPIFRPIIQWAVSQCQQVITVSHALKLRLLELGANEVSVTTLSNGVDASVFKPAEDRQALRSLLGIDRTCCISVGNLVALKRHDRVIQAVAKLPSVQLIIIGSGPEQAALSGLVDELALSDRVSLLPSQPQRVLRDYYAAADVLVLASEREGFANVLLESLACGTPVVATCVGGNAEIVADAVAGTVVAEDATAICEGIRQVLAAGSDRAAVAHYAQRFSWKETIDGMWRCFTSLKRDT